MIRVCLIAADAVARARLEAMLPAADFELVREDGEFAAIDVTVLAADSWAEAAELPAPVVLVGGDMALTGELLDAGVRAVLPGNCGAEELAAAIQAVAAGLVAYPASMMPAAAEPGIGLSPRERQVLRMMAEGLANKEIAWRLQISEHTVKFHVASILNRLDAASRAQAVAIGMRRGMIML